MNSQKPFKTYNQQLKILRSRNIDIPDGSKTIKILKREGYYNIVNGYKEIFLDKTQTSQKTRIGTKMAQNLITYMLYTILIVP